MNRANLILKCLVLLAAGLLPAMAGGCASDRQVVGQARQFHSGLEPAVVEDPVLAEYLQDVGDRVIQAAADYNRRRGGTAENRKEDASWMFDGKMRFHFVNSKTLNAFTTGGEHMYIYTQLFREAQSEDELAAVMAHEFAHVYARHVHKGMNRQMVTMAAGLGAAGLGYAAGGSQSGAQYAGAFGGAAALAGQFIGSNFTRQDEAEADKLGYIFYVRAGWDPDKFDDFFQHMIDKGLDKTPEIMSDHPSLANRVKAAQTRTASLENRREAREWRREPVADAREFRRLQDRAAEVGRTMPDDKSLAQTQELLAAMPRSCLTPLDNTALPDQRAAQERVVADMTSEQQRVGAAQPQQQRRRRR